MKRTALSRRYEVAYCVTVVTVPFALYRMGE